MCQSLGAEVHRLALQVQVLEESDTVAIEAEAVPSLHHTSCCSAVSVVISGSTVQFPCSCPCLIAGVPALLAAIAVHVLMDFDLILNGTFRLLRLQGLWKSDCALHAHICALHS